MNTQHIKVFADICLEEKQVIDSSNLKTFINDVVRLPATYEEVLIALAEMSSEHRLEPINVTKEFALYKKVK